MANKLGVSIFGTRKTLASSGFNHKDNSHIESANRPVEYLDALSTLELTIWMAMLYDQPVNRAVRQSCKSVLARLTDWKVKAIVYGVFKSNDPAMYVLNLIADMELIFDGFELKRQEVANVIK